jgi:VanZ family protein
MTLLSTTLPFLVWNDKIQHFGAYLGLAFLAVLGFERRRVGAGLALSMILLGGVLEVGQLFSPGRTADILDAAADSCGVLSGLALALPLTGRLAARKSESPPGGRGQE